MQNLCSVFQWTALVAATIVMAQVMNSVEFSYFEQVPAAATAPVATARNAVPARVGSMWIAVPPDRASDNRNIFDLDLLRSKLRTGQ